MHSRLRPSLLAAIAAISLAAPAPAFGHVAHTVEPGETLWSIALASNLTTRSLAAANGLSEDAHVLAGQTVQIPPGTGPVAAPGTAPAASPAPQPLGAYTVRPGDTLTGIAARSGVPTAQLAFMNGLSPTAHVLAGTLLKLPTGAPRPATPPPPLPPVVPHAHPHPTPGQVSAGEIGQIASLHGVSPSLASAVAWQESGFENGLVSPANARGVMQILPGTWSWIEGTLARRRLDPYSPLENVHAGVMYLQRLIADSGGDPVTGVASYYQGQSSVRRMGLLPETQRYVQNVLSLRSRFGG